MFQLITLILITNWIRFFFTLLQPFIVRVTYFILIADIFEHAMRFFRHVFAVLKENGFWNILSVAYYLYVKFVFNVWNKNFIFISIYLLRFFDRKHCKILYRSRIKMKLIRFFERRYLYIKFIFLYIYCKHDNKTQLYFCFAKIIFTL